MTAGQILILLGLVSFPAYVAHREGASGGKYAGGWAATEVSLLLLFVILGILTQETSAWVLYLYVASPLLSYWRLFELRNSSHVPMPLSVIAWVLGIALAVAVVFFVVTLNRYAFVRQGENHTEVYDRFTGEHRL